MHMPSLISCSVSSAVRAAIARRVPGVGLVPPDPDSFTLFGRGAPVPRAPWGRWGKRKRGDEEELQVGVRCSGVRCSARNEPGVAVDLAIGVDVVYSYRPCAVVKQAADAQEVDDEAMPDFDDWGTGGKRSLLQGLSCACLKRGALNRCQQGACATTLA